MASSGISSANHLAGELFKMMGRGSYARALSWRSLVDLLGGQVQFMFASIFFIARVRQGAQASRSGGDRLGALRSAAAHSHLE
jgi:hypothetical protein